MNVRDEIIGERAGKNNWAKATSRYAAATTLFVLVAFFWAAGSAIAQNVVRVRVDEDARIVKFNKLIDPKSVIVDYDLRTRTIDKIPTVAAIILSEDQTEFRVQGLKEGETTIGLKVKDVRIPVMGRPNESPLEREDLYAATIRIVVLGAAAEKRRDQFYEVSSNTPISPTLSSLLGAKFSRAGDAGIEWRNLRVEISPRGRTIATAEANPNTMRLDIIGGEKRGEKMKIILRGEEKAAADSWREVFCEITVAVRGQKAAPPATPEEILKKLNGEIKAQVNNLEQLSPEEQAELLNELQALEKRLEEEIKREEADAFDVTPAELRAKRERLDKMRNLLNEIKRNKKIVEDGISRNKSRPANSSTVIFDRLKQRYETELKPAAANAENLSDAQKNLLRREWEPMPVYLEQLIDEENKSAQPRASLLREMNLLKNAVRDDLKKLDNKPAKGNIGWFDTPDLLQIADRIGERFTFTCPGFPGNDATLYSSGEFAGTITRTSNINGRTITGSVIIYGSGPYSSNSSVCAAAVHAGVIPLTGGKVAVEIRPPLTGNFSGSLKNGIKTTGSDLYYQSSASSFVFTR